MASINAENISLTGEPQEQYHLIIEEAYVVLGLLETQVDELRTELEYQHKRLDEIRDEALAKEKKLDLDAEGAGSPAHEDWANEE